MPAAQEAPRLIILSRDREEADAVKQDEGAQRRKLHLNRAATPRKRTILSRKVK
jgi:hypothetical protein